MTIRRAGGRLTAVALGAAFAVLLLTVATARGGGGGELSRVSGPSACISTTGSQGACEDGRVVGGTAAAMSPDGRSIYIVSYPGDTMSVFERNPSSGTLRQASGAAGCLAARPKQAGCTAARGFDEPLDVAVSPDGKTVYVASDESEAVTIFDRDPADGALRQRPGAAGCISRSGGEGCEADASLKDPAALAISPDGGSLYVASGDSGAVAIFCRDPDSGALRGEGSVSGCVPSSAGAGCQDFGSTHLTVSPDGRSVYLTGFKQGGPEGTGSVVSFDRDPASGALSQQAGAAGCIVTAGAAGPYRKDAGLEGLPTRLVLSPDGRDAYVASEGGRGALAVLDRDPGSGALRPKQGRAGCISLDGTGGACQKAALGQGITGLAISPDGSSVYVAAAFAKALTIFDRNRASGALRRSRGPAGCISTYSHNGRCRLDPSLGVPANALVGPNGRDVYVTSLFPGTVSIFRRAGR